MSLYKKIALTHEDKRDHTNSIRLLKGKFVSSQIIPVFLLCLSFSCKPVQQETPDLFDLEFRYGDNARWVQGGYATQAEDSMESISGKHPMSFVPVGFGDKAVLSFNLSQIILLPEQDKEEAVVQISNKCTNIQNALLKVFCMDNQENILWTDSCNINNDNAWTVKKIKAPVAGVRLLKLRLEFSGNPAKPEQKVSLDRMRIFMDGKDVRNLYSLHDYTVPNPVIRGLITLTPDDIDAYRRISVLKDKKIIGLGESMYGSKDIGEMAATCIKSMVVHNNCKLVIFEMPMYLMLKWNLFIQDEANYTYEDFLVDYGITTASPEIFFDLLQWLKSYNRDHARKIRIFGMDRAVSSGTTGYSDYLYHFITKKGRTPQLDTISYLEAAGKIEEAAVFLKTSDRLRAVLGKEESTYYQYSLDMRISVPKTVSELDIKAELWPFAGNISRFRDSLMWKNAVFAIDTELADDETAVLYAHFGHLNKRDVSLALGYPSLGKHLVDRYGDDYGMIGLFAGKGNHVVLRNNAIIYETLLTPPENSVEYLCLKTNENCFYIPSTVLADDVYQMRHIGRGPGEVQFFYVNPRQRADGFIFVGNSRGFEIPALWEDRAKLDKIQNDRFFESLERNNEMRDKYNRNR